MKTKIVSCDWEENPNEVIDIFAKALKKFGLFCHEINTGADDYAVLISDAEVSDEEAEKEYDKYLENL